MTNEMQDLGREVAIGMDGISRAVHGFRDSFRYSAGELPQAIKRVEQSLDTIANHLEDMRGNDAEVDAILEDPNIVGLDAQVIAIHRNEILTIVGISKLFNRDIIEIQEILRLKSK